MKNKKSLPPLREVYDALYDHFGPQHWWPGKTRIEVIVGAILTQNTSWTNVEKALLNLKRVGALDVRTLHETGEERIAAWIRPAGTYRVKAERLKAFAAMVHADYGGRLDRLLKEPVEELRKRLLEVKGIGPETADSILLYASKHPVFVVDAYTTRFLRRHGWIEGRATYDQIASMFIGLLPGDVALYNEYHALIVALGKDYCRAKPRCEACPLKNWLPPGGAKE